jgi:hypothetical protein
MHVALRERGSCSVVEVCPGCVLCCDVLFFSFVEFKLRLQIKVCCDMSVFNCVASICKALTCLVFIRFSFGACALFVCLVLHTD